MPRVLCPVVTLSACLLRGMAGRLGSPALATPIPGGPACPKWWMRDSFCGPAVGLRPPREHTAPLFPTGPAPLGPWGSCTGVPSSGHWGAPASLGREDRVRVPSGEGTAKSDRCQGEVSVQCWLTLRVRATLGRPIHTARRGRPWTPMELRLARTSRVGAGGRGNLDACWRNSSGAGELAPPLCPQGRRAVGAPPPPLPAA